MAWRADELLDRRRLKRGLAVWRTLAVVALVALVALGVGRFGAIGERDHIARLDISGFILDDPRLDDAIERLRTNDRVKAVLVRVDSPGGTVVGGESLYRSLRQLASDKPVVALMGSVAASAGYMVAIAADHVLARHGTITGSIGVLLQTAEITELLRRIGISTEAIRSGALKARPSPLEPMTPDARHATQALVDDMHDLFVAMVAERRDMTDAEARAIADGRVFTGRLAAEARLIDGIGGEDEARAWLERERGIDPALPVRDVVVVGELRRLLEGAASLAGKVILSEPLTLDGLISVWQPALR